MKKKHLLVILFFFISIETFSQDYIMIEYVAPSDKYLPTLMVNMRESAELYNFDSICHTFTHFMTCDNIELDSGRYQVFKNLLLKAQKNARSKLGNTDFRIIIISGSKKKYFYTSSEKSVVFFTELNKKVKLNNIDNKLLIKLEGIIKYLRNY